MASGRGHAGGVSGFAGTAGPVRYRSGAAVARRRVSRASRADQGNRGASRLAVRADHRIRARFSADRVRTDGADVASRVESVSPAFRGVRSSGASGIHATSRPGDRARQRTGGVGASAVIRIALLIIAAGAGAAQQIAFEPASQDVIEQRVRAFTTKNATRETALHKLFEDAGCAGEAWTEQPFKGSSEPNLICTHRGERDSTIVVGAHFDLVERGQGVVDNWSGAALLPSLYQGLVSTPRAHTFVFVAFAGEEKGLLGSRAYTKRIEDRSRIRAMVNLDTLGLSDTKVWASHADPELVNWIGVAAGNMKLPIGAVNVDKVG